MRYLLIVLFVLRCVLASKSQWIDSNNLEVPAIDLDYHNNGHLAQIAAAVQSLLPIKEMLIKQYSENNATNESELSNTKSEVNVLKERLLGLEREALLLNMTATKMHEEARCAKESIIAINNSLQLEKKICELKLASLKNEDTIEATCSRLESLIQTQIMQKHNASQTILVELHKSLAEIANTIKFIHDKEEISRDASFVELSKKYENLTMKKQQLESAINESEIKLTSTELCCKNLSTMKEQQNSLTQGHNTAVNTLQSIIANLHKDLSIMNGSRKEVENKMITLQHNYDSILREEKNKLEKCEQNSRDLQNKVNELNLNKKSLEGQVETLCKGKGSHGLKKLGTGSYYFVNHIRLSWYAAEKFCRNIGLDLVIIETQEENNLIINHLREIGLENGMEGFYWTSGSDQGFEGRFYWTATGQDMGFTFWHSGQPDNYGRNEHCVEIWHIGSPGNIKWNDRPCTSQGRFICELNSACA